MKDSVKDSSCRDHRTVSVVLPEMLPAVAVMTDEPTPMLVARPVAATMATEVVPEVQVTVMK